MAKQKVITIHSPLRVFFEEYLQALKAMHQLPNHEAKLMAELMYNYHILKTKALEDKYRWKILFDYDTKIEIREYLGISGQALENKLTMLRRKGFIVNGKLNPDYILDPAESFALIYNWKIDAEDDEADNKGTEQKA